MPSFGHLSDLFASLPIKTKQYCDKLSKRVKNGESVALIVDSSGMKFDHASEWYQKKYNKPSDRRPWRKIHIAIDSDMNMHGLQITEETTADIHEVENLLAAAKSNIAVNALLGDGGYYCKDMSERLINQGITPVIPPPKHSVVTENQEHPWHNKIVQYIKDKGTVYAFHKKYGYGQRSLVEAQFSRIKRCIGERLLTHKLASQKNEGIIIANIINLWNSFGKCHAVKIEDSNG